MKIHIIHIANNLNVSKKDLDFVNNIIIKHSDKAQKLLPFEQANLTLTIYAWEKDGISAFTQANDWIDIKINFEQLFGKKKINNDLLDQLIYIIYHEMHHACRGYVGILPKNQEHILINSMISEGLADDFALSQYTSQFLKKTKSFDLAEIDIWIQKLRKVMWDKESDDDTWLYGGQGKPKLLGYKIGRYIAQQIKEKNPQLNIVDLVQVSPEKILTLSKIIFKL